MTAIEGTHGTATLSMAGFEIVVHQGHVCLVRGVQGHVPRLGEVLARMHPESAAQVQQALQRAQQRGQLLGEALIESGVNAQHVREAVRAHFAAGLAYIAKHDVTQIVTREIAPLKLDTRLSRFSAAELYLAAVGADTPLTTATSFFGTWVDNARQAVLVRIDEQCMPVDAKGMSLDRVSSIARVSRAAATLLQHRSGSVWQAGESWVGVNDGRYAALMALPEMKEVALAHAKRLLSATAEDLRQ